jgi:hypothetical protein
MLADELENLTPAEKEVYDLRVASAPSRLKDATDDRELVRGARAAQLNTELTAAVQRQREVMRQLSETIGGVREAGTLQMEATMALNAAMAASAAAARAATVARAVEMEAASAALKVATAEVAAASALVGQISI